MTIEMFLFICAMCLSAYLALYVNLHTLSKFYKRFTSWMLIFFFMVIVFLTMWNLIHTFFPGVLR